MYLKAIELHGFKSFPEKTKIEFEKGMSGVVGPNGSGKSNISDAIRWVLGETRSSQLRAAGKMEDIIFGGTQKRSPMGFASVSLILDNTDHAFDVESDEVAVMRKYYRGGDSEYYINGARVRLRDIQELFFDTGLGKNGYSVVREIGGHGIGLEFHEEPFVSYVSQKGTEMLMVPGMIFTIEPMINMGGHEIFIDEENDWVVYTADAMPSAQTWK